MFISFFLPFNLFVPLVCVPRCRSGEGGRRPIPKGAASTQPPSSRSRSSERARRPADTRVRRRGPSTHASRSKVRTAARSRPGAHEAGFGKHTHHARKGRMDVCGGSGPTDGGPGGRGRLESMTALETQGVVNPEIYDRSVANQSAALTDKNAQGPMTKRRT